MMMAIDGPFISIIDDSLKGLQLLTSVTDRCLDLLPRVFTKQIPVSQTQLGIAALQTKQNKQRAHNRVTLSEASRTFERQYANRGFEMRQ